MKVIWFKNACSFLLPMPKESKVKLWEIQTRKQIQVSGKLEQLQHKNSALQKSKYILSCYTQRWLHKVICIIQMLTEIEI